MTVARLLPAPVRGAILRGLRSVGYELVPTPERAPLPPDLAREPGFVSAFARSRQFTMTPPERMFTQYLAVRHVVAHRVPGAIVECGVWKGGSMMMAALALAELGDTSRDLYLYDTFGGMAEPREIDVSSHTGEVAAQSWRELAKGDVVDWCYSPLDEVRRNLASTGYPQERIHYVQGKVEETIPGTIPGEIALLRLDTDWYDSTYHELRHLYPLVSPNGVVIIDDYGYWEGARQATDDYLRETGEPLLLGRIDSSARVAVKPPR
jgi:O-methyltransferase